MYNLLVMITIFSIMPVFFFFYHNVYCFRFSEKRESDLQGQVNTEVFHSQWTQRQGGDITEYMQLEKKSPRYST